MGMHPKKTKLGQRWNDSIAKWVDRLWLNNYRINCQIVDEICQTHSQTSDPSWGVAAETHAAPHYREALITGAKSELTRLSESEVDSIACHELVHVVLAPYKEWAETTLAALPEDRRHGYAQWLTRVNEEVTSHITSIVTGAKWSDDCADCHVRAEEAACVSCEGGATACAQS